MSFSIAHPTIVIESLLSLPCSLPLTRYPMSRRDLEGEYMGKELCGCCGANYGDEDCKSGNPICRACAEYYRPDGFPCMRGVRCLNNLQGTGYVRSHCVGC